MNNCFAAIKVNYHYVGTPMHSYSQSLCNMCIRNEFRSSVVCHIYTTLIITDGSPCRQSAFSHCFFFRHKTCSPLLYKWFNIPTFLQWSHDCVRCFVAGGNKTHHDKRLKNSVNVIYSASTIHLTLQLCEPIVDHYNNFKCTIDASFIKANMWSCFPLPKLGIK